MPRGSHKEKRQPAAAPAKPPGPPHKPSRDATATDVLEELRRIFRVLDALGTAAARTSARTDEEIERLEDLVDGAERAFADVRKLREQNPGAHDAEDEVTQTEDRIVVIYACAELACRPTQDWVREAQGELCSAAYSAARDAWTWISSIWPPRDGAE